MLRATVAGYIRILLPAPMQDPASELRRRPIPRTWVNKASLRRALLFGATHAGMDRALVRDKLSEIIDLLLPLEPSKSLFGKGEG